MSAVTLPKCVRSSGFAPLFVGVACAITVVAVSAATIADPADTLPIATFSSASVAPGTLPDGWRGLTFPAINSHTLYELVADRDNGRVMKAQASASASGLFKRIDADPNEWPLLRWRWKVSGLVAKSDLSSKYGDDYPARIYVAFAYDPRRLSLLERVWYSAAKLIYGDYPPQSGMNYVWEGKAPAGTIAPNAYTSRIRMIVVESGPARVGEWVEYERNIVDDYRRAFGEDPPRISGIAIMTDTDNTGESVTAWYGDIALAHARR